MLEKGKKWIKEHRDVIREVAMVGTLSLGINLGVELQKWLNEPKMGSLEFKISPEERPRLTWRAMAKDRLGREHLLVSCKLDGNDSQSEYLKEVLPNIVKMYDDGTL